MKPLPEWDALLLMRLFHGRRLARLDSHAISPELVAKLLAWKHPGFSAQVGEPVACEQKLRLEDTAAYLVRNPLSLKKLVYLDGERAVIYRSRMNPPWDDTSRPWTPRVAGPPQRPHPGRGAAPHPLLRRVLEPRQGLR